ncbi:MAG: hypothetical protein ACYC2H_01200 [Thermoplasmatota archaeon]
MANQTFRFDAHAHEYIANDTGEVLPHITAFLRAGCLVDDRWFKDEHRERGKHVHALTADYDLGAIEDPKESTSLYKGYLLAYAKAKAGLRPTWDAIEEPRVHWGYRIAGCPDRVGVVMGGVALGDIKSGVEVKARATVTGGRIVSVAAIQMAIQAIIVAPERHVPPESILRFGIYGKSNGKSRVVPYTDQRDFDVAYRLIKDYRQLALEGMAA